TLSPHSPPPRRDEHEEEGSENLREQPAPLLTRVLEVVQRVDDLAIEVTKHRRCARLRLLLHCHLLPTGQEGSPPPGREGGSSRSWALWASRPIVRRASSTGAGDA